MSTAIASCWGVNEQASNLSYFPKKTNTAASPTNSEIVLLSGRELLLTHNSDVMVKMFDVISNWKPNWDGHGSEAPNLVSIKNARAWMQKTFEVVAAYNLFWQPPLISTDESGYIVCEWWNGNKKFTLDFEEDCVEYTKISNIDTNPDFEMGTFSELDEVSRYDLIEWIFLK
jgi:hypothetical protein